VKEVLILNKHEIKQLLMSMRTYDNESQINKLLGKIELLSDEKIETMVIQIGDNEESIKKYLQKKLEEKQEHNNEEHIPINKMFSYGISGGCIHLHMPVDLHQMMKEKGPSKTISTVNLYLLDAIERIRMLKNEGYYKFKGKDSIYMISPILVDREMRFLEELDFKTQIYKKGELQDADFLSVHPEAQLATHIFGNNSNVGTAIIGMDIINSDEWQEKRRAQIEEFAEKGITLDGVEKDINE